MNVTAYLAYLPSACGCPCSPGCCLASSHDGRLQQSAGTAALESFSWQYDNDLIRWQNLSFKPLRIWHTNACKGSYDRKYVDQVEEGSWKQDLPGNEILKASSWNR